MIIQRHNKKDGMIRLNTDNDVIALSVSNREGDVRTTASVCFCASNSPAVYAALENLIKAIEADNALDGQDLK